MNKIYFAAIACAFLATSCSKTEGTGGTGSITGKVTYDEYLYVNGTQTQIVQDLDAVGEDVYIVYGDGNAVADKIETSFDGTFEFNYLQPGDYTVFSYNKIWHAGNNLTNNDDDYYTNEVVKVAVSVKKKSATDVGTIALRK